MVDAELQSAADLAKAHASVIPGGLCVKRLDDNPEWCIDVMRMMFNWRVVVSPHNGGDHRMHVAGFCYFGHGLDDGGDVRTMDTAYIRALGAAWLWDGTGTPVGFDKQAFDGRWEIGFPG